MKQTTACLWLSVLEERDIHYQYDDENNRITIKYTIENKLGKCTLNVNFFGDSGDYSVVGSVNEKVNPKFTATMSSVAELIARINYKLSFGHFEMDYSDGRVFFYYSMDLEDAIVSKNQIVNAVNFTVNAISKYGDALYDVINGVCSPTEALKRIE